MLPLLIGALGAVGAVAAAKQIFQVPKRKAARTPSDLLRVYPNGQIQAAGPLPQYRPLQVGATWSTPNPFQQTTQEIRPPAPPGTYWEQQPISDRSDYGTYVLKAYNSSGMKQPTAGGSFATVLPSLGTAQLAASAPDPTKPPPPGKMWKKTPLTGSALAVSQALNPSATGERFMYSLIDAPKTLAPTAKAPAGAWEWDGNHWASIAPGRPGMSWTGSYYIYSETNPSGAFAKYYQVSPGVWQAADQIR